MEKEGHLIYYEGNDDLSLMNEDMKSNIALNTDEVDPASTARGARILMMFTNWSISGLSEWSWSPFTILRSLAQNARSGSIDPKAREKNILDDRIPPVKVLLLGSSEGGYETLFRNLQLSAQEQTTDEERMIHKAAIVREVRSEVNKMLTKVFPASYKSSDATLAEAISQLQDESLASDEDKILNLVRCVCNVDEVQQYLEADACTVGSFTKYFLEDLIKLPQHGSYQPTPKDVLEFKYRRGSLGTADLWWNGTEFQFLNLPRGTERRKYIHMFESIEAILHAVNFAAWTDSMHTDCNQMQDSLILFKSICESRWFAEKTIVLFFANAQHLTETVATCNLTSLKSSYLKECEDFVGDANDTEQVRQYIVNCFFVIARASNHPLVIINESLDTERNPVSLVQEAVLGLKLKPGW